ncbi:amino acid adenylation domain-containing protein [Micromonospora sediminicola]|uniref:Amino acid adenylation domain-containing protein n=1 Tax=Micromonospora sediminicola TaxID=946078 RepID=A0A1A9BAG2_9ACTN|nr:non-ribosomal peptide synthetase [Micromonospora sediminicola]SBT65882.1 amino acid adenylation domain-containing protein [Micromonospora sediminicola]
MVSRTSGVTANAEHRSAPAPEATDDLEQDLDTAHTLHELIQAQAERTPDAIAVESGSQQMRFRELDLAARGFARTLAARGVSARSPVGVWCNRGPNLLVALLGVLHAGAAFIPLDPDLPPARVRSMLAEAGADHCVVDNPACGPVDDLAVEVIPVTGDAGDPLTVPVDPDDLVSIYYTSGSTGKPKGVAITHRGWVNRMRWMQQRHELHPGEGVLQKTVLSFDVSAVELFWPLIVGGRVVMLERGLHRDPRAIARTAAAHEVAVLHFVPSMLALFLDDVAGSPPPTLRHVISSGEALRPELVRRFHEVFRGTECSLHNQWGPTEASIDATIHTCSPEDAGLAAVPIGKPLTNYRVHVLDESGTPAPSGVEGELYIGGVGLARCYWNDPAKTAEAFLPDPAVPGERLYRTGDRAVRGPDGAITFLGRRDHQVKIRGNRVELGEIERTLARHPEVADAVVTVYEPQPDDKRLLAYVVGRFGMVDTEAVRYFLIERLPGYMLPARLIALSELPLTASGKVDRARLPVPTNEAPVAGRAPHSESELLVAEVWARFLPATDADADFFELGGHSLLGTQIISGLRRALGLELPLMLLFDNPTIADLALAIERELLSEPEDVPR